MLKKKESCNTKICRECGEHHTRKQSNVCYVCTHNKTHYGFYTPERDALLESQGGLCKICSNKISFPGRGGSRTNRNFRTDAAVDHCHSTNKVRGILCVRCNALIGQADEDENLLLLMVKYIQENTKMTKTYVITENHEMQYVYYVEAENEEEALRLHQNEDSTFSHSDGDMIERIIEVEEDDY